MSNKIYKLIFTAKTGDLEILFEDAEKISEKDEVRVYTEIKRMKHRIADLVDDYNKTIDLIEN